VQKNRGIFFFHFGASRCFIQPSGHTRKKLDEKAVAKCGMYGGSISVWWDAMAFAARL
jgi:hypothetical protein